MPNKYFRWDVVIINLIISRLVQELYVQVSVVDTVSVSADLVLNIRIRIQVTQKDRIQPSLDPDPT